jgi:putative CocE/NonD family hydrolase
MAFYREHMQYGNEQAKAQHYLIIGPWDHAGTRTPKKEFGGLTFGDASLVDLNKLHKEWYDWTMKDGEKPEFLKDRVAYYVVEAEEWKYAASLEAIPAKSRKLYLHSTHGEANDVFRAGALSEHEPETDEPDTYTYDPLDARPAEIEPVDAEDYLIDQSYVMNLFGNGLVYHSEPFAEATEMTGSARFVAWIEIDVPDTDFLASLDLILPNGRSIQLTQDTLRARYRESLREEKLITPGEINQYVFDGFTFTSRRIAKGSRLRLVLRSPNTIYLQKNYNSGGIVAEESKEDARIAHVKLYHDAEHPSYLELPLTQRNEDTDEHR